MRTIGLSSDTALTTAQLDQLKVQGGSFVFRYYCTSNGNSKLLTLAEADSIVNAGLTIAIVFEDYGGAHRKGEPETKSHIEDFDPAVATSNAATALARAAQIGQPAGSAIYFAVDFDFQAQSDLNHIVGYFRVIADAFSKQTISYRLGVYGSGLVCKTVSASVPAVEFRWLTYSTGWADTSDYNDWTVDQHRSGTYFTLTGIGAGDVEDNIASSQDFGQFTLAPAALVAAPVPHLAYLSHVSHGPSTYALFEDNHPQSAGLHLYKDGVLQKCDTSMSSLLAHPLPQLAARNLSFRFANSIPQPDASAAIFKQAQAADGVLVTSNVPDTNNGHLACAWAVNTVVNRALGHDVGGGLSTTDMNVTLVERVKQGIALGVPEAQISEGFIIISPSGSGAGGGVGHVGIVGEMVNANPDDRRIYSNSSGAGLFEHYYTIGTWREEMGPDGRRLDILYYELLS